MAFPFSLTLDEYEAVNLREGLLTLRALGLDTGDWLGQIEQRIPEAGKLRPNQTMGQQRGALAQRVGFAVLPWSVLAL